MTMYFIPGMRPAMVDGAVGRSASKPRAPRIVSGSAYKGLATPRGIVPYEDATGPDPTLVKAKKAARAKDVADALHFVRDAPTSAREKLRDTKAAAAEVKI